MNDFPKHFRPMLAKVADGPFARDGWIFETKWDGFRALTFIRDGKIDLLSRNLKSFNDRYSEIIEALSKIKKDVVLDGEIVNLDRFGKSDFQALQLWQEEHRGELTYQIFDIIYADGKDLSSLPLIERKKILKSILPASNIVKYCPHIANDGLKFWAEVRRKKIEGMMAKNGQSKYQKNRRAADWLKVKNAKSLEAIIIGYTDPEGGRKHFGSILVASHKKKKLTYIGHVGTGFDEKTLASLHQKFKKLASKMPAVKIPDLKETVHWVKPKLVAEIKYNEITRDNILRQPAFLRLREDKEARETELE